MNVDNLILTNEEWNDINRSALEEGIESLIEECIESGDPFFKYGRILAMENKPLDFTVKDKNVVAKVKEYKGKIN